MAKMFSFNGSGRKIPKGAKVCGKCNRQYHFKGEACLANKTKKDTSRVGVNLVEPQSLQRFTTEDIVSSSSIEDALDKIRNHPTLIDVTTNVDGSTTRHFSNGTKETWHPTPPRKLSAKSKINNTTNEGQATNSKTHKFNSPAVEHENNTKEWYIEGERHGDGRATYGAGPAPNRFLVSVTKNTDGTTTRNYSDGSSETSLSGRLT